MTAIEAVWCEAYGRRCYGATAGGRWQLSWRVGRGMPHVRHFEPELTECQVLAKQPASALPGSFLRLAEVVDARVRVWMHCDASVLAANRLDLLRRLDTTLDGADGTEDLVRRWAKQWGSVRLSYDDAQDAELLHALKALEEALGRARQRVAETQCASEVVRVDDGAGLQVLESRGAEHFAALSGPWTSAVSAACSEARMLAYAWRTLDRTLAGEFEAMAETLACRRPPSWTPRARRAVQEIDMRPSERVALTRGPA